MEKLSRRPLARLAIAGAMLFFALACGQTTCDCVTPLDQPMPESEKVYDAVQARLTPAAFGFIENNLTDIIGTFLAGGLTFDVPRMDERFCAPPFNWPCFNIRICENTCTLTADIVHASMARVAPDVLALTARIDLTGVITIRGSLDCDVAIDVRNKPVHADVRLIIDGRDHLMTFNVENLSVSLSNSDYDLDCSWWIDWLMELLKGVITNLINSQVGSQLDGALADAMAGVKCLNCDFYTSGCPTGSSCNGDGYCMQDGACRIKPLGIVGTMDMGTLLADISPGMQAELDLFVAAGQWESASVDALVVNDGVELRLIGGADAERNVCVPIPDPAEIPSSAPPPRLPFSNTVPDTADSFMAGFGASDTFLDWFMYKAFLSGLLCLSIDTETTGGLLSSGTLAALLGSLNTLTEGRNTPIKLKLVPNHVPYMEVGAGTFTTDAQGNRVIDEPLLYVYMPGMGLDFNVLVHERWVRVVTLTQDITLKIGLDFTPDNTIVPMFDEHSILIENVVATNYELLAEDPASLESLVPTLVTMALPMLTGAMAPIELPPIEGFALDILAAKGALPRPNTDFFEYLGIYANLRMAANPLPAPRNTQARVAAVRTPELSRMSIFAPGGPHYPEVVLAVGADAGPAAEYSFRVDGGPWSIYQPGPELIVHNPLLALTGPHSIEVRARSIGDYLTLDPEPARVTVAITPRDDGLRYEPPLGPKGLKRLADLGIAPMAQPLASAGSATERGEPSDEPHVGCATSSADGGLLALLVLGLCWRRRRSGR